MFLKKKKINPVHAFRREDTGKSHLVKTIYQAISKELLYHSKEPDKPRVFLLGPTGISAVNIGRTTIHSRLDIKTGANYLA